MLLGLAFMHRYFYFPDAAAEFGIKNIVPARELDFLMLDFITLAEDAYFFSSVMSFFSVLLINKIRLKSYTLDRFIQLVLPAYFFSPFDILDGNFDLTLNHLWFLYCCLYSLLDSLFCTSLWVQRYFKEIHNSRVDGNITIINYDWALSILINGSLSHYYFTHLKHI